MARLWNNTRILYGGESYVLQQKFHVTSTKATKEAMQGDTEDLWKLSLLCGIVSLLGCLFRCMIMWFDGYHLCVGLKIRFL